MIDSVTFGLSNLRIIAWASVQVLIKVQQWREQDMTLRVTLHAEEYIIKILE